MHREHANERQNSFASTGGGSGGGAAVESGSVDISLQKHSCVRARRRSCIPDAPRRANVETSHRGDVAEEVITFFFSFMYFFSLGSRVSGCESRPLWCRRVSQSSLTHTAAFAGAVLVLFCEPPSCVVP